MTDQPTKHDTPHTPPAPMKDGEGRTPPEVSNARLDAAAADKSKRESGKDKEHHKR